MNHPPIGASDFKSGTYAWRVRISRWHFVALIAFLLLTACDGYIEEVKVRRDGEVELAAQAIVVCNDPLQEAIFDGDPCEIIDRAVRTGEIGELPFGVDVDPNEVSLVASGEADRRTVDALWRTSAVELETLLVSGGEINVLDDQRTEVIFFPADAPVQQLAETDDPELNELVRRSRWAASEFRINTPDLIEEHNGDRIQGRIVIWDLDGDHPDEFRVVWTTEDPPRQIWGFAVAGVVLVGVLAMMLVLESPKRRSGSLTATAESATTD